MLRFFAPQFVTGKRVFSVQLGAPVVVVVTPPGNPTPPPPPPPVDLTAGDPSTAAPVVFTGQLKLDREFGTMAAPEQRTVLLAKPGSTSL